MKERGSETGAYFSLWRGERHLLSEMGVERHAAEILLKSPDGSRCQIAGQYVLPIDGVQAGDMQLWIPSKEKERSVRLEYEAAKKKLAVLTGNRPI